jgi:hypothetical protein
METEDSIDTLAYIARLRDALRELVGEWDASHAHEDHRTGYTLDTGGIRMARALLED